MADEGMSWLQLVWMTVGTAFLAGIIGSVASGFVLRLMLLLLLGTGLFLALLMARVPEADRPMTGTGYVEALSGPIKALHAVISVLYHFGIAVVVFAALVRTRLVDAEVPTGLAASLPFLMGFFILLLGTAGVARVQGRGGTMHNWGTRAHGQFITGLGAVVGVLALILLFVPTLQSGGNIILRSQDLPPLVLLVLLGVCTQLFLTAGLPTSVELMQSLARTVRGLQDKPKDEVQRASTPPIVYAGIVGISAAAIIVFILAYFDVFGAIGGLRDERVIYVIAAVPLALVFSFLYSAYGIYREGRRGLYTKKITTKVRNDIVVYGLSGLAGLVGFVLLIGNFSGWYDTLFGLPAGRNMAKDLTFFTIMATTGPIGAYLHRQNRRIDGIEFRLPDFLNDLAEQRRAGLTLPVALKASSKVDYGELSPEIKKMAAQVGWGISFNDALQQFANRVNTALVTRSVSLVIEASRTGGSVTEILKAAARDAYDIKNLESERRTTMATFLIVIYVVFFVFMTVLASLATQFLPEILAAQQAQVDSDLAASSDIGGTLIDPAQINYIYFNASMVQSLGNGLVGGVLAEGRVTAGFRHVAIMAVAGWVVFRLLIG